MRRSHPSLPRRVLPRTHHHPTAALLRQMQLSSNTRKMVEDFPILRHTTLPPPYLPTDEAERSKAEAAVPLVTGRVSEEDFVARDDFEDADQLRIGNDGIFMLTFFMAFLFNWIGFFLSFCLTTSAAGRYGAISGFGLSLIKWVLIVRFSTYFPGYFDGQYWLWWVFLALGFMLFIRGFVNYSRVRKLVDPAYGTLPRTRVLFIY
ncbi:NEDD4 family-interacting protein 1-like [Oryzias melastigma]|uniref:NEDD4 family-interacting protein 1-like n=1 Tax=Oryzias melastigma TaxID=30732 RepID=A0A834FG74_ORYME|nr:NEDD4 family-interacting protein 1-like [Oryzias melastigma]